MSSLGSPSFPLWSVVIGRLDWHGGYHQAVKAVVCHLFNHEDLFLILFCCCYRCCCIIFSLLVLLLLSLSYCIFVISFVVNFVLSIIGNIVVVSHVVVSHTVVSVFSLLLLVPSLFLLRGRYIDGHKVLINKKK